MPRETQAARMAAPAAHHASAPPSGGDHTTTVKTRFGVIEFDLNQALTFPKAIPGFVGYQTFGLAMIPGETQSSFMLLQALDPDDLSFIVLPRSEEHTSELQSLMRISYAVFCLKKKHQHS